MRCLCYLDNDQLRHDSQVAWSVYSLSSGYQLLSFFTDRSLSNCNFTDRRHHRNQPRAIEYLEPYYCIINDVDDGRLLPLSRSRLMINCASTMIQAEQKYKFDVKVRPPLAIGLRECLPLRTAIDDLRWMLWSRYPCT